MAAGSIMKKYVFPARALVAPLALLTVFSTWSVVSAQPGVPRVNPRLNVANLTLIQPKISPQLRSYLLAKKPVVSEAVLQKSFVLRDGIVAFKLDDGTTRLLMEPKPVTEVPAAPVPPELDAVKSYILAPVNLQNARLSAITINKFLIPTGVDHRADMSPIRDQGGRGTCTAFAFMGAVEAFPNVRTDMSEQYLFHEGQRKAGQPYSTHKGLLPTIAAQVGTEGLVTEDKMPYTASYPPDNETIPAAAVSAPKYKVAEWVFIPNSGLTGPSIRNTNYIETLLKQGYNIPFWTQVAWYGSHTNDVIDVVMTGTGANKKPAASGGDHEMVIIGYNAPEKYFIVRNSWGTGFGHSGYAYMSYDYIRTYAVEGLYIKKMNAPPKILGPIIHNGQIFKAPIRHIP